MLTKALVLLTDRFIGLLTGLTEGKALDVAFVSSPERMGKEVGSLAGYAGGF